MRDTSLLRTSSELVSEQLLSRCEFKFVPEAALTRAALSMPYWGIMRIPGYVSLFFELIVSLSLLDSLYCNWKQIQPKGWCHWIKSWSVQPLIGFVKTNVVIPALKSTLKKQVEKTLGICGRASACVCFVVLLAEVPIWLESIPDSSCQWANFLRLSKPAEHA